MNYLNPLAHHMSESDDAEAWPPEIRAVFVAIGDAMNGSRRAPGTLAALASEHGSTIAGHHVSVTHLSAREIRQRRGCYTVMIDGPRVHGTWSFVSGP
jgi:hypothetical protein